MDIFLNWLHNQVIFGVLKRKLLKIENWKQTKPGLVILCGCESA